MPKFQLFSWKGINIGIVILFFMHKPYMLSRTPSVQRVGMYLGGDSSYLIGGNEKEFKDRLPKDVLEDKQSKDSSVKTCGVCNTILFRAFNFKNQIVCSSCYSSLTK